MDFLSLFTDLGTPQKLGVGALATNLVGSFLKHKVRGNWIPNDAIPFINFGLGTGAGLVLTGGNVEQAVGLGAAWAAGGTGLHQGGKILKRAAPGLAKLAVGGLVKGLGKLFGK